MEYHFWGAPPQNPPSYVSPPRPPPVYQPPAQNDQPLIFQDAYPPPFALPHPHPIYPINPPVHPGLMVPQVLPPVPPAPPCTPSPRPADLQPARTRARARAEAQANLARHRRTSEIQYRAEQISDWSISRRNWDVAHASFHQYWNFIHRICAWREEVHRHQSQSMLDPANLGSPSQNLGDGLVNPPDESHLIPPSQINPQYGQSTTVNNNQHLPNPMYTYFDPNNQSSQSIRPPPQPMQVEGSTRDNQSAVTPSAGTQMGEYTAAPPRGTRSDIWPSATTERRTQESAPSLLTLSRPSTLPNIAHPSIRYHSNPTDHQDCTSDSNSEQLDLNRTPSTLGRYTPGHPFDPNIATRNDYQPSPINVGFCLIPDSAIAGNNRYLAQAFNDCDQSSSFSSDIRFIKSLQELYDLLSPTEDITGPPVRAKEISRNEVDSGISTKDDLPSDQEKRGDNANHTAEETDIGGLWFSTSATKERQIDGVLLSQRTSQNITTKALIAEVTKKLEKIASDYEEDDQ